MDAVTITEFQAGGKTIRAKTPLVIKPVKEDIFQVYRLPAIGLDCYVDDARPDRAVPDVRAELTFLWKCYACDADDNLDPEALRVKQELHERFIEV